MKKKHIGSKLDDFLHEKGLPAEFRTTAWQRVASEKKLLEDLNDLASIAKRRGEATIPHGQFKLSLKRDAKTNFHH